jgi:MATE family multidrug resistance protein
MTTAASDSAMGEARTQMRYGAQISLSYLMKKSLDIVSFSFVGHQGALYLSAAGLALVTANVTGNSILLGLGGAQSTLCSQANGARDLDSLNAVFQRALIISLLTCVPISVLWMFAEAVLLSLGQEAEVAYHAAQFMLWLIPGNLFFAFSLCIQNWLFSQHQMAGPAVIITIVALFHIFWNYLFVISFDFGYLGAALAISVSRLMELLLLLSYISYSGALEDANFAWSKRCLEQWRPFFILLSGNVMMMSELWASEVLTFLSGTLANAQVEMAAMSIYQSINAFCFQFSNGLQAVACTRVGNLLGAGHAASAERAAKIAAYLAFASTVFVSTSLLLFGKYFILIYTNDPEVIDATLILMPILALYVVGDGTVAAMSGTIKGLGKQRVAGRIVVFSYYAVAIPISVLLAYHWGGNINFGMGTLGLCLGTLVGTYTHLFLYSIYIFYVTDWDEEVDAAKTRIEMNRSGSSSSGNSNSQVFSPAKISNAYDEDNDWDDSDGSEGGFGTNSLGRRLSRGIAHLFSRVPFFGSSAESEANIRQCEYALVKVCTSDLEQSQAMLDADDVFSDDDDYIFN